MKFTGILAFVLVAMSLSGCTSAMESLSNALMPWESTGDPEEVSDSHVVVTSVPYFARVSIAFDMQEGSEMISIAFPTGLFLVSKDSFTAVMFQKYKKPAVTQKISSSLTKSGKYTLAVYQEKGRVHLLLNNVTLHSFTTTDYQEGNTVTSYIKNPQKKSMKSSKLTMLTGEEAIKAYNACVFQAKKKQRSQGLRPS